MEQKYLADISEKLRILDIEIAKEEKTPLLSAAGERVSPVYNKNINKRYIKSIFDSNNKNG